MAATSIVALGGIGVARGACKAAEHLLVDSRLAADTVVSAFKAVAPDPTSYVRVCVRVLACSVVCLIVYFCARARTCVCVCVCVCDSSV